MLHRSHLSFLLAIGLAVIALAACSAERPVNPSFPLSTRDAKLALKQMQRDQKPLPRPVIVLGGIHDPGFAPSHIADVIRDSVPDRTQIIDIAFFSNLSFDDCADNVIEDVEEAFPDDDPASTIEVDVVGFSMGGIVARYAASPQYAAKSGVRLRIARLYTISSPHTGAELADLPTFDSRAKDMREDSTFLKSLNGDDENDSPDDPGRSAGADAPYEIIAYVRLHDGVVGAEHAAPPGATAWWVPSGFTMAHTFAGHDQRILADILRRLRGEQPFTIEPPAPIPD